MTFFGQAKATHNRAGQITYKWVGPGFYTYEIKLTTYTNIGGTNLADRCEDTVYFGDGAKAVVLRSNGLCNGSCSPSCEGQPLPGGTIKLNQYVTTHTYPGPGNYKMSMEDPNRNAGVINIPNSVNQVFYVESFLVIPAFGIGKNSSPILTFPPIDNACVGRCFKHNPGAYDIDGDSISYELTPCRGHLGVICPGYSNPAIGSGNFTIDSLTGTLEWCTPQAQGEYNMAMLIKEWRKDDDGNYFLVGYIERDMQVDVGICNNNNPHIVLNNQNVFPVAGTTVSKTITANDPDGDVLTMEARGGPFAAPMPSAIFSSTSGIFSWQTSINHVRRMPYQVTVKVIDNDPYIKLVDFKTFNIKIIPHAPVNLIALPSYQHIVLKWQKPSSYITTGSNPFLRYNVYKKDSVSNWLPAINETTPPAYTGFTYIGSTSGNITDTSFTDYNNGNPFVSGKDYSYVVLAEYKDGATSQVSNIAISQIYVGINERTLETAEFQAIPNPANEELVIVFNKQALEWQYIELMDITGRTIKLLTAKEDITQANTIRLNLDNINPGIYFLKITGPCNDAITKKIIKQ
ncbi:MAG: T9SS type A sorting domain-containing protein [Bacteroidota bacterium]